ncbi:MAG: hypothetical protein WDO16_18200 [Bacteroidota bacterium]
MKLTALILSFVLFGGLLSAQENKTFTVNELRDTASELTGSIYHYRKFVDGKVIFKDNVSVDAK